MPIAPQTFHLKLAPERSLAVTVTDVASAIAAARDAITFLQWTGEARDGDAPAGEEGSYILNCLLCSSKEAYSSLIELQEHLMAEHGLPVEALRSAVRVCAWNAGEERFVWTLSEATAGILGLSQASFMRASRVWRSTPAESPREQPPAEALAGEVTILRFTRTSEGQEVRQDVYLFKEDACAWYGWERELETVFVWPKGEWELAH